MRKLLSLSALGTLLASPALAASGPFFSLRNTDFVVLLGFLLFLGVLVYFKVPQMLTGQLDKRAAGILCHDAIAAVSGVHQPAKDGFTHLRRLIDLVEGGVAGKERFPGAAIRGVHRAGGDCHILCSFRCMRARRLPLGAGVFSLLKILFQAVGQGIPTGAVPFQQH